MHQILSYSKYGIEKIDKPKERLKHYFNQTRLSAERLMHLLDDLLDLSKLEAGMMDYQIESNDLYRIICDIESELIHTIREKRLILEVGEPGMPTLVPCDRYKIDQVARNILSNAIKFTPETKKIAVRFETVESAVGGLSTPSILVSVADQGIGIPVDELESVFDKFTQSSKTKTGAGGTGLGLAICKEIIEAHQGRIWAVNNPDGGSTFNFVLPCHREKRRF